MDKVNIATVDLVKKFISEKKLEDAKLIFDCKKNKLSLIDGVGDIMPLICSAIVEKSVSDFEFIILDSFMEFYINNASPKELLMYLLEALEEHLRQPLSAVVLLIPLQRTLLRIPEKRGTTLNWVLSSLSTLVKNIELPTAHNYEGEERKLLDLDPEVMNCREVLTCVADFLKPFVNEVTLKCDVNSSTALAEKIYLQRKYLSSFIFSLMGQTFIFLDLHHDLGDAESQIRLCAEKLVEYLANMRGNVFSVISESHGEYGSDKDDLSTAVLAYLLIGEELPISLPLVFSPTHFFITYLRYTVPLLSRSEDLLIHKGLLLASGIFNKLGENQLPDNLLDLSEIIEFPKCLIQVMIYCQVQEHRKNALGIFKIYMSKLNTKSRCELLHILFQNQVHSGAKSLILDLYKSGVHQELTQPQPNQELIFAGRILHPFVKRAIYLPDEERTDLLENFDTILSTLNFLRYLFIRDKKTVNQTKIWDLLKYIQKHFLEPLRMGLQLSKAHYKLELENFNNKTWKNAETNINVLTSVGGQNLPPLNEQNHHELCLSALTNFELTQSLLVRLEENINSQ